MRGLQITILITNASVEIERETPLRNEARIPGRNRNSKQAHRREAAGEGRAGRVDGAGTPEVEKRIRGEGGGAE